MLTRSRLNLGEGELIEPISRRTFSRTMSSPRGEEQGHTEWEKPAIFETEFLEAFINMKAMMEIFLDERAERKKKEEGSSSKDAEVSRKKRVKE